MKFSKYLPILLIFLCANTAIFSQNTGDIDSPKNHSVIIMPFLDSEHYPFAMDEIRHSLIVGFLAKGFRVIEDDSTWAVVLECDYNLANLSTDMAEKVAQVSNADLIVFGNINIFNNARPAGFNSSLNVNKPILVKVFDRKKQSLVLFERQNMYEYWGLTPRYNSIYDLANKIATRLNSMGY